MSEPSHFGALESWVPSVRGDFGEAGWWHPSVLHCGLGVIALAPALNLTLSLALALTITLTLTLTLALAQGLAQA